MAVATSRWAGVRLWGPLCFLLGPPTGAGQQNGVSRAVGIPGVRGTYKCRSAVKWLQTRDPNTALSSGPAEIHKNLVKDNQFICLEMRNAEAMS